jgi:hypothetical protein
MCRNVFENAAARIGSTKPNDPTNLRTSSLSALARKWVPLGPHRRPVRLRSREQLGRPVHSRVRVYVNRTLAEARGVDVEYKEPDPTGPTSCILCDELIERDADHCHKCCKVQDFERA